MVPMANAVELVEIGVGPQMIVEETVHLEG